MKHEVRGCLGCPLYDDGKESEWVATCKHPGSKGEIIKMDYSFIPGLYMPDWCPLKQDKLTIKLAPRI